MTNPDTSEADVDDSTQTKTCAKCREVKASTDFHVGCVYCKPCRKAIRRRRQFAEWEFVPQLPPGFLLCRVCCTAKPLGDFSPSKIKSARCRACNHEFSQAWSARNPAAVAKSKSKSNAKHAVANSLRRKAYYKANRTAELDSNKSWMAANVDRQKEAALRWRRDNPEKVAELGRRQRAKRKSAPTYGPIDTAVLWTGVCAICGESMDSDLRHPHPLSKSIDHIRPLSRGGAHAQENLQWTHLSCNVRKRDKLPSDDLADAEQQAREDNPGH